MTDYRDTTGKSSKERQTSGLFDDYEGPGSDIVDDDESFDPDIPGSDTVSDTVENVGSTIPGVSVDDVVDATPGTDYAQDAYEGGRSTLADISDAGNIQESISDEGVFGTTIDAVSKVGDVGTDVATDAAGDIAGASTEISDFSSEAVLDTAFGEGTQEDIKDVGSGVRDTFDDTVGDIGDSLGDFDPVDTTTDVLSGGTDFATDLGGDALDTATDLGGGAFDTATDFGSGAFDFASDVGGDALDTATDFGSGAFDFASDIGGDALDTATDFGGGAIDFGTDIGGGALDLGGDAVDFGGDVLGGTLSAGAGVVDKTVDTVTGDGSGEEWSDLKKAEEIGACVILKQESNKDNTRYAVQTANNQGDPVFVKSDGSFVPQDSISSNSDIPFHGNLDAARSACSNADMDVVWGEGAEKVEEVGKCTIQSAETADGETVYSAIVPISQTEIAFIDQDGELVEASTLDSLGDEPRFNTLEAARQACYDSGYGIEWSEPETVEQKGGCVIQSAENNRGDKRFTVLTTTEDGEAAFVAQDGEILPQSSLEGGASIPTYDTLSAARSACENTDRDVAWSEPQTAEKHDYGAILVQENESGDKRYFAVSQNQDGQNVFMAADGSMVRPGENDKLGDLPHYNNIDEARAALDNHPQSGRKWSKLQQVGTVGNCAILAQASSDGEKRFFAFTKAENGELVALSNEGDGVVVSSVENAQQLPHYPTAEDARKACPSTEGKPEQGGDKGTTDDSTSPDGPSSDNVVSEDEVGEGGEGPPDVSEEERGRLGGGGSGPDTESGGPLGSDIAGIPTPLLAVGAVGLAGAAAVALGGDDGPKKSKRTRAERKNNVTKKQQQNKNKGES